MKKIRHLMIPALHILAFSLIGIGVWLIYPPACLIVSGVLVLIDLSRKDSKP